jgi:beta-galactosidase
MYDWENRWAIDQTAGPRNERKDYQSTCVDHYRPFWSAGVACDVVSEDSDLSGYKLLIAPMLYMIRPGMAERIEAFVRNGGTFVTTYLSGIVNESDLCFQNGFPGPLRRIMGVWAEEIDSLYDNEKVAVVAASDNTSGLNGTYDAGIFCDVIHAEGAQVLATYGSEFYAGMPAVTVNNYGAGKAYYIASRNDHRFHHDFYAQLINSLGLRRALGTTLPDGVTAQIRTDGENDYIFVLGFNREPVEIDLGNGQFVDYLTKEPVSGVLQLAPYSTRILSSVAG